MPYNITLYTIDRNLKIPHVFWYTLANPEFFTVVVCKVGAKCYEKMFLTGKRKASTTYPWTPPLNITLETGRHRLYIVSHSRNLSVNSTTDFIIGK